MNFNAFDNRKNVNRNMKTKTFYRLLTNVSMTYGSIVECFRIWLTNDMKHICDFKHTYIESQFNGTQDFLFREGMLMTVEKPNLSLQYNIDHTNKLDAITHPSLNNMESVNIMRPQQFTESFISNNDNKNSIDVRLAYKITKIVVNIGVVAQSRSQADNIAHYWSYRRQDNTVYVSNFLVDFEIPPYVIDILYDKYKISRKTHRPMLKWLNRHSSHLVYYGINTFNGKPRFFIKLKVKPLLRPNGLSNPQGYEEQTLGSEMWTLTRNFEIDVIVPSMIGITGYTHPDNDYDITDVTTLNDDILNNLRHKTVEEYGIQIDDKHAIAEIEYRLDSSDIETLPDGSKISKKLDISDMLQNEGLMMLFNKWAVSKGLDASDVYDFVVNKYVEGTPYVTLAKNHTLSEALEKLNMNIDEYKEFVDKNEIKFDSLNGKFFTINDLHIPDETKEYDHYIKNSKEFWFVDLEPNENKTYRITLYCSMRLYNQFVLETGHSLEEFISVDDAHNEFATGKFKELSNPQDRY